MLRLPAPLKGHGARDRGGLGPCLEGSCQELPDLPRESTCCAWRWGCWCLGHTPAVSDQSQLLFFSTPPGKGGPRPWDLGESSPRPGRLEAGRWCQSDKTPPPVPFVLLSSLWPWGKGPGHRPTFGLGCPAAARALGMGPCPGRLLATACPGNSATAPSHPCSCVTSPFLA